MRVDSLQTRRCAATFAGIYHANGRLIPGDANRASVIAGGGAPSREACLILRTDSGRGDSQYGPVFSEPLRARGVCAQRAWVSLTVFSLCETRRFEK